MLYGPLFVEQLPVSLELLEGTIVDGWEGARFPSGVGPAEKVVDVLQNGPAGNDEKLFVLVIAIQDHKDVDMTCIHVLTSHGKAVLLAKSLDLHVKRSVGTRVMYEKVNRLCVAHSERDLHAALE